jgi:hypothetical protein
MRTLLRYQKEYGAWNPHTGKGAGVNLCHKERIG